MPLHPSHSSKVHEPLKSLMSQAVIHSPCPVMITDAAGGIEYVNPLFTQLTGYSLEEIKGKTPRILKSSHTPLSLHQNLWRTILSGAIWRGEICNKRKSGEEFWELISINSIKDARGAVTHFVSVWQDITARKVHDEEVLHQKQVFENQSQHDELTGLFNRRHIFLALEREFTRACRYERPLSGMMIDVDDFKQLNDRYGHLTGDRILRAFAKVLHKSIRTMDILGRYGGDEFLLILPETGIHKAGFIAGRIRKNLQDYQENVMGEFGVLTASIGLVTLDDSCRGDKTLFLEKIDRVLLLAKSAGKNTVVIG